MNLPKGVFTIFHTVQRAFPRLEFSFFFQISWWHRELNSQTSSQINFANKKPDKRRHICRQRSESWFLFQTIFFVSNKWIFLKREKHCSKFPFETQQSRVTISGSEFRKLSFDSGTLNRFKSMNRFNSNSVTLLSADILMRTWPSWSHWAQRK